MDWGDGQLEEVVVKPDGTIQAEHTYAGAGTFLVTFILSDDEGLTISDSRSVVVESPVETIGNLIPGTEADCVLYDLTGGQCDTLVVHLEGTLVDLENDRPSAPQKLGAYLNEFEAVVPDAVVTPCFLVATDVLNGLVPPPD